MVAGSYVSHGRRSGPSARPEDLPVTEPRPTPSAAGPVTPADEPYEKRWLALGVIAMTVLLVILDATIVNIALPAVTADLGISAATQQWIVTAYTLTFGGFLLLGGRIADFWGRKRTYLVGAGGFAIGSAVGLLLGGVLTEYADWRWCFWVNIPIAVLAIVAAIPFVPESKAPGDTSYDIPGAVLVTLGLASFVYGFTRVAQNAQENAEAGISDNAW